MFNLITVMTVKTIDFFHKKIEQHNSFQHYLYEMFLEYKNSIKAADMTTLYYKRKEIQGASIAP